MNSFAFAIPVHPPHYHHIYNLINQHEFKGIDIFLIFSTDKDYQKFEYKNKIIPIILPKDIKTNNIVSFKKLFALQFILVNQGYDCFIVCDSEISLINENFNVKNVLEKINNFFENKLIYGGNTNNNTINEIVKSSSNIFYNENDKLILKNITNNYNLYSWWSDMPFYKRSHLVDFFSKFNYNNINWLHFDHTIYVHYLLLYQNFKIVNLTDIISLNWSFECYYTNDINNLHILKNNRFLFTWVTPKLFNRFKDFFIENKTLLLYHLDR